MTPLSFEVKPFAETTRHIKTSWTISFVALLATGLLVVVAGISGEGKLLASLNQKEVFWFGYLAVVVITSTAIIFAYKARIKVRIIANRFEEIFLDRQLLYVCIERTDNGGKNIVEEVLRANVNEVNDATDAVTKALLRKEFFGDDSNEFLRCDVDAGLTTRILKGNIHAALRLGFNLSPDFLYFMGEEFGKPAEEIREEFLVETDRGA